jgi:hypothetical protein
VAKSWSEVKRLAGSSVRGSASQMSCVPNRTKGRTTVPLLSFTWAIPQYIQVVRHRHRDNSAFFVVYSFFHFMFRKIVCSVLIQKDRSHSYSLLFASLRIENCNTQRYILLLSPLFV